MTMSVTMSPERVRRGESPIWRFYADLVDGEWPIACLQVCSSDEKLTLWFHSLEEIAAFGRQIEVEAMAVMAEVAAAKQKVA